MPNLQHQYLHEKKHATFATPKFTCAKKTPNLQHQNLREKKNAKFKTSKFTWKKNREIHNITYNIEDNIGRVP